MEQYRVRQDGTVIKIEADGSLTELGKIGETNTKQTRPDVGIYWLFILLFVITTVIAFITAANLSDENHRLSNEKYDLNQSYSQLNTKWQEALESKKKTEAKLTKVGAVYPIIINSVAIGNMAEGSGMETDFGQLIYHYNTMYLKPKITYEAITTRQITLKVKLFTPSGILSRGDSSPTGYSFSYLLKVAGGTNTEIMNGWGNSTRGYWGAGTYRLEIWYDDVCLKTKSFTIY